MPQVVIVDSSVFLNILNVPGFNQNYQPIIDRFGILLQENASFLLPIATVFQTGDHIADLADGGQRRRCALVFREQVRKALTRQAPWRTIPFPDGRQLNEWIGDFPNSAMRGPSFSNLSIIKSWEDTCALNPNLRVRIWSLNRHLEGYDRIP